MNICDAVKAVKQSCGTDHDERELYMWCDEVAAYLDKGKKHSPLRLVAYRGEAFFEPDEGYIKTARCGFLKGDMINIRAALPGTIKVLGERLPLYGTEYDASGFRLRFAPSALRGIKRGGRECVITRAVTDETLCPKPYDVLYIDYMLAKLSLIRRNSESYRKYIRAFSSGLSEYKSRMERNARELI